MNLLLMILAAVAVVVLLAFLIVKFIPLKLRGLISILLLVASVYLAYLIYGGIMEPIKFNKEKKVRYAKVIKNLKVIRNAQVKYNEVYNKYASNKAEIIRFIENDSLAITQTDNYDSIVDIGGGLTESKTFKRTIITDYEYIKDFFDGVDYNEAFKVPGTSDEFKIETGEIEKVAGLMVPVFIVKADKKAILEGMNKSLVKRELEAKETDQIKGEFVSIGSLSEVSTGGNWPPAYDNGDQGDKKE